MCVRTSVRTCGKLLAMALVLCVGGCDAPSRQASQDQWQQSGNQQAWSILRNAQAQRLKRLSTFSSSGQFTLRWYEGEKRQWEQLDQRIWWQLPDRMAIRLSTLGSRIALAGWNGRSWWVFDETREEIHLSIFSVTARGTGENQLLSPPLLLCLAGLVPFPEKPPADLAVSSSGVVRFTLDPISVHVGKNPVSMELAARIELDPAGPRSVELLAGDGSVVARSTLSKIMPVECRGVAQGAWPNVPFRMHMVMPSETGKNSEARLTLDRPFAGGEVPTTMFDLDQLVARIAPASTSDQRSGR